MRRKRQEEEDDSLAADTRCSLRLAPCLPQRERAVAVGFRQWMLGLTSADIEVWQSAWHMYAELFGVDGARHMVGYLSRWVGELCRSGSRDIEVFPKNCSSFCRDECLAVSLIAACQHRDADAARLAAQELIASPAVDHVLSSAYEFADALSRFDFRLEHASMLVSTRCNGVADVVLQ